MKCKATVTHSLSIKPRNIFLTNKNKVKQCKVIKKKKRNQHKNYNE
jgi:hypothetical protein